MNEENVGYIEQVESFENLSRESLLLFAARSLAWRAAESIPAWSTRKPAATSLIDSFDLELVRKLLAGADDIDRAMRSLRRAGFVEHHMFDGDDEFMRNRFSIGIALEVFRASRARSGTTQVAPTGEDQFMVAQRMKWPELQALIQGGFTIDQVEGLATELLHLALNGCGEAIEFLRQIGMNVNVSVTIEEGRCVGKQTAHTVASFS